MSPLPPCPACGTTTLLPAGGDGATRAVCSHCGRCWDRGDPWVEVNTLTCPGCGRRTLCESRPTALVEQLSTVHELSDGSHVLVRPLLPSDRDELAAGYQLLSDESRRLRFFAAPGALSENDLDYLVNIDYHDHFAWAAFAIDEPGQPGVGVARYIRDRRQPTSAEAAVTVLDDYQNRGIGTLLLLLLAERAQQSGITSFVNYVLWDNRELLEGLAAFGARIEPDEPGIARVEVEIPPPDEPTRVMNIRALLRHFARIARVYLGLEPGKEETQDHESHP